MDKILGRKKKKDVRAQCPITKEQIDKGFGYLLTTAQVVASHKYWDMVMTEPETMSYTISHFKNEENGTRMRSLIFEKYSSVEKPWMISDSCINLFESIDKKTAREHALQWWDNDGHFVPENSGPAYEALGPDRYKDLRQYAVMEAGRARISA